MNVFALTFTLMLAIVLLELLAMRYWRKEAIPWHEIVFNLNSGHILMWALRGVEVAVFGWLLTHANLHLVDRLPIYAQWLVAIIGWDLSFYCMHRAHHRWPLLWAVHRVHHQGEHFSLSLGIRNSWYSSLTSLLFVAPLAILGLPLELFVAASSFHYAVQLYNHNAFVGRSGWLEGLLVTPAAHRVHHATHPLYLNRNFGGTFLLWDCCFGSYQPPRDDVPLVYGVPGSAVTYSPLLASNPWLAAWSWLWSQAGRGDAGRPISGSYIASGAVLLFGWVIYYVQMTGRFSPWQQWSLFGALLAGTLALGAMSDRQPRGWWAWQLLTLVLPLLCVVLLGLRDAAALALSALLLLHGVLGWRRAGGEA